VIVTRRRRKPFPWKRLILPAVAIALVAFALSWAPSRGVITGGPMAPLWRSTSTTFDAVAAPFHFAAQNQLLTQRDREIADLRTQLAAAQSQSKAKDKQIGALNNQVVQLQTQIASAHVAPVKTAASGAPLAAAGLQNGGVAAASSSTADQALSRTAQYWANMEPENAAKVVEKLPVPYVARVLAQMPPDAVGAILDAVPAAFAAQLTQENPQLKR
jgi:flagellar motility protein MotE (MotC chaperone)